jgi:phenylpropionate dioxygenase-like ring-hydroxylating dioxygenase large terminal subunit
MGRGDEWAYGGALLDIQCNYRLMIDNLMDLTHETYVHASSIGQKEIDEAPPLTTVQGDEVVTARHMENIMAPPSGAWPCVATTSPMMCRWNAGRSAVSPRPAMC